MTDNDNRWDDMVRSSLRAYHEAVRNLSIETTKDSGEDADFKAAEEMATYLTSHYYAAMRLMGFEHDTVLAGFAASACSVKDELDRAVEKMHAELDSEEGKTDGT